MAGVRHFGFVGGSHDGSIYGGYTLWKFRHDRLSGVQVMSSDRVFRLSDTLNEEKLKNE